MNEASSTILVVEDDAIISEDIRRTLRRLGYRVGAIASTGDQALSFVAAEAPDLVLMDIKLKGNLDGIETTQLLQQRHTVPVIYLTGNSDEATLMRAKETAPHGFLVKPFNERDLRTAIEVAIRKFEVEQQLAARERWFATTLESIGDAVIATDGAGRITFMNAIAEQVTGWNRAQAQGVAVADVFHLIDGQGQTIADPVVQALESGFAVTIPSDARIIQRDGTVRAVDDSSTPIIDAQGNVLGGVVVFRDVTDRKRLEHRLALSERLASVGTMTAGMAHEINSPLAAVIGNLDYLRDQLPKGTNDNLTEALADAREAAQRVSCIIRELRHFTRVDADRREAVDLTAAVNAALTMTQGQVRHCATVVRQLGATPPVLADEGKITQVLVNMIANAAQAIGDGGVSQHTITIRTATDDVGRAVIEVADTGPGIAKDVLSRIFDPFFTTKDVGAGMGLGLSICDRIIRDVGGEIVVESELGRGTTMRIFLPAAEASVLLPLQQSAPPPAVRRGKILVIDDEPTIGRTLQRVLGADHDVVVETSGRLALLRLTTERPDIILCDLMMPDVGGADVYASLHARDPALADRIVWLTGGATSQRTEALLASTANITLSKPFSLDALRRLLSDFIR